MRPKSEILVPDDAGAMQPVDFKRGSSEMRDADAWGHLADKLGEVRDGLRALAFRTGLRGLTPRQTYAHVYDHMTMARDSMRAVALLRGNEQWLDFAKMIETIRDKFTAIAAVPLRGWPTDHFLKLAQCFDRITAEVGKLRHRRETLSKGWNRGTE